MAMPGLLRKSNGEWMVPPALALVAALIAVYSLSLRGWFLNYDDPWLIRDNPLLHDGRLAALATIWADLAEKTRLALGAEYLPLRDTSLWLEARVHGLDPRALRATNLLLFIAAALIFRAYLRRAVTDQRLAEVAAWLFALHPVHAESVAWLAGRKDVLALLFMALALFSYAQERGASSSAWRWATPGLCLLAMLSKGVAVVAPFLLLTHDLLARRRPRWPALAASAVLVLAVLVVDLRVGGVVGMVAPLPGGTRLAAAATMGPVWVRYLMNAFLPLKLSVTYDVPLRGASDVWGWLSYGALVVIALGASWSWRRGHRLPAFAFIWFLTALAPTSQVLVPLQNLMADRYLLVAVMGPCLALAALLSRLPRAMASAGLVLLFGILTASRALVFSDSVLLWHDALDKTTQSPTPPYQLAMAYQEARQRRPAEVAFRIARQRAQPGDDLGRAAGNNLAALLTEESRLDEAQTLLHEVVAAFPNDARALNNLAEVTARKGQADEARALFESLVRRFPEYEPGRRNYHKRYGGKK